MFDLLLLHVQCIPSGRCLISQLTFHRSRLPMCFLVLHEVLCSNSRLQSVLRLFQLPTARRSRAFEVDPFPLGVFLLRRVGFFLPGASTLQSRHRFLTVALQGCFTPIPSLPSERIPTARSDAGRLDLMQEPQVKAEGVESPSR